MHFMGMGGNLHWFIGVVEDRMDPLKLGRCRVRIHGFHSEEKTPNDRTGQGIPTNELPWAYPMGSLHDASMDGIGNTPLGPVEGTWIVGFARDGEVMNDLIMIGTLGGKPEDPPKDNKGKLGFVDPRSAGEIAGSPRFINQEEGRDPSYPSQEIPMGRYPQEKFLKDSHVNRLARGEKLDSTYIPVKKKNKISGIPTKTMGGTWDEKSSPYAARYPYNSVRETEAGHVVEFDDTKGAERIHVWFNSKEGKGTYAEIHPDGSIQVKSMGDHFEIAIKDRRVYAKGNVSITADGDVDILAKTGSVNISASVGSVQVNALEGGFDVTTNLPITLNSLTEVTVTAPKINLNTADLNIDDIPFYSGN